MIHAHAFLADQFLNARAAQLGELRGEIDIEATARVVGERCESTCLRLRCGRRRFVRSR
jgi:hypothetical protein